MRHLNRGRRLGRNSSHRKAMYRNMVAALFTHGRIITTPAKAKEARPFAERLITLAKKGPDDLAARRRAIRLLHDPALVRSLFEDLGVRYKDRQGGYTRILHLSKTRVGDAARQVLFELVEGGTPGKSKAARPRAAVAKDDNAGSQAAYSEAKQMDKINAAEEKAEVDVAKELDAGEEEVAPSKQGVDSFEMGKTDKEKSE